MNRITTLCHDFRAAALGLTLTFGMAVPAFAWQASDTSPQSSGQKAQAEKEFAEQELLRLEVMSGNYRLDVVDINKKMQYIHDGYETAGIKIDAALSDRIKFAGIHANVVSAESGMGRLNNWKLSTHALPVDVSHQIADMNQNIRDNYAAAGITIDAALDARIQAALSRAYKVSADTELAMLEKLNEPATMTEVDGDGEDLRANYNSAGIVIDAALEAKIVDAVVHAHKASADTLLEWMEKRREPFPDYIIKQERDDLYNHFRAAGVTVDTILKTRIEAALTHAAHPTSAPKQVASMQP